jgi:anti-anti-sigma factor
VLDLVGTIEAAELPDGTYLVSAHGPLDERIAGTLRDTLLPLAAADGATLVLDLTDAHGFDQATVEVVARAAQAAARREKRLALVTRSPFVLDLVRESDLDRLLVVFPTLKDAVA